MKILKVTIAAIAFLMSTITIQDYEPENWSWKDHNLICVEMYSKLKKAGMPIIMNIEIKCESFKLIS